MTTSSAWRIATAAAEPPGPGGGAAPGASAPAGREPPGVPAPAAHEPAGSPRATGRELPSGDSPRRDATAWLGLGTNLGDRRARLTAALAAIARLGTVAAVSPVYATAPIGYAPQPDFWNLVVRLRTPLPPEALLAAVKAAEAQLGRVPTFRDGPREIDIDLLLYDGVVRGTTPVLPHPRMHLRAFVLRPLLDLDPDVRDPRDGTRWADRLPAVADQRIQRVLDGTTLLEGA